MQSHYLKIYFPVLAVKIGKYAFRALFLSVYMFQHAGKRANMNSLTDESFNSYIFQGALWHYYPLCTRVSLHHADWLKRIILTCIMTSFAGSSLQIWPNRVHEHPNRSIHLDMNVNADLQSPYLGHRDQVVADISGAESEHYWQTNPRAEEPDFNLVFEVMWKVTCK